MEQKTTIAVVDDHKQVRTTIVTYLTKLGFDIIVEAENGEDLLGQLSGLSALPDVCLVDYRMPRMKGDELAARVSKLYPSIKLAAMTANTDVNTLINMIGNGCSSFFTKNSNPHEWKAGIEQLMTKGYHYTEWMEKKLLGFIRENYAAE